MYYYANDEFSHRRVRERKRQGEGGEKEGEAREREKAVVNSTKN